MGHHGLALSPGRGYPVSTQSMSNCNCTTTNRFSQFLIDISEKELRGSGRGMLRARYPATLFPEPFSNMSPLLRQPLTVEHALLGFLQQQPMHGYEIYQHLAGLAGLGLVWQVKQSHLYALLDKLEADGY